MGLHVKQGVQQHVKLGFPFIERVPERLLRGSLSAACAIKKNKVRTLIFVGLDGSTVALAAGVWGDGMDGMPERAKDCSTGRGQSSDGVGECEGNEVEVVGSTEDGSLHGCEGRAGGGSSFFRLREEPKSTVRSVIMRDPFWPIRRVSMVASTARWGIDTLCAALRAPFRTLFMVHRRERKARR